MWFFIRLLLRVIAKKKTVKILLKKVEKLKWLRDNYARSETALKRLETMIKETDALAKNFTVWKYIKHEAKYMLIKQTPSAIKSLY
jgi:hypothetical protein